MFISYYKRYVEDIFVLFELETQVELFKTFMNTFHPKMKFTSEKEQDNCFNFLEVKVIREDNVFTTLLYLNALLEVFAHILIVTCH